MQHATASQRIQENYRVIYIEILVRLSIRVLDAETNDKNFSLLSPSPLVLCVCLCVNMSIVTFANGNAVSMESRAFVFTSFFFFFLSCVNQLAYWCGLIFSLSWKMPDPTTTFQCLWTTKYAFFSPFKLLFESYFFCSSCTCRHFDCCLPVNEFLLIVSRANFKPCNNCVHFVINEFCISRLTHFLVFYCCSLALLFAHTLKDINTVMKLFIKITPITSLYILLSYLLSNLLSM